MALKESNVFERERVAPAFSLVDTVTGSVQTLNDVRGDKGTVIMFICNHCPYVIHVNGGLVELTNDYNSKGIGFVAISSNDALSYPQDAPDKMKVHATKSGYPFPYLYDETQNVAKSYSAACTPDLYVFNKELKSIYHGQLDDSRPGNGIEVTGNSIRGVLDELLLSGDYSGDEKPSIGCSIKWK